VNFLLSSNVTILLNAFLDESKTKTKTSAAVKNPSTYTPNSKYHIPKNDSVVMPTAE